jgi:hypothetical protein
VANAVVLVLSHVDTQRAGGVKVRGRAWTWARRPACESRSQ